MNRWRGTVAVVTGASSGIGANICQKLVEQGLQVVGFARRVERVQQLATSLKGKKGKLHAVKCDVSNHEEVCKSFQWVKENIGLVQILVNNAGLVKFGTLIEGDPQDWKTTLDTNVIGLCMCTREAFKQMKEGGLQGHVVHINSVAGHYVVTGHPPMFNMYSPSKHAVTCLTEVMRAEITHSKAHVKVTSISPGYVKTEIMQAAGLNSEGLGSNMNNVPALNSEDISDAVVYVLGTPPHVHIQELTIRPFGENIDAMKMD